MLIHYWPSPKRELTIIKESATLQEAIDILEDSGYRCVPILDETETIFRGNIYKMHIYRHKANGGDMSLPVTHLLKNATKFISIDSSFFKVFFTIKELPYITVLNTDMTFYGILTHNALLNMLAQSWSIDVGSDVLTAIAPGQKRRPLQHHEDDQQTFLHRQLHFTGHQPRGCFTTGFGHFACRNLKTIARYDRSGLERKDYRVTEIENLQADF